MLSSIKHAKLKAWIQEIAELTQPESIHICDGSEKEYQSLCDEMVRNGTLIRLNEKKRPNSFLARSNPQDVARVEQKTFICSKEQKDAGLRTIGAIQLKCSKN